MGMTEITGIRLVRSVTRLRMATYYRDNIKDTRSLNGIQLITAGEAVFNTGFKRVQAKKGDVLCFGQHTVLDRAPVPGSLVSFRMVNFEIFNIHGRTMPMHETGLPFFIRPRSPEMVLDLMKALDREFHSRNDLKTMNCSSFCLELLALLHKEAKSSGRPGRASTRPIHSRIREALDFINANYKAKLDVPGLARTACMHPAYFSHLFKKEVGIPPGRYILELKIAQAKDFLVNHDTALSYTGEELGFHDYSHFYRIFRKITGLTPRQYVQTRKPLYDPR